jgi:hypothetical protein
MTEYSIKSFRLVIMSFKAWFGCSNINVKYKYHLPVYQDLLPATMTVCLSVCLPIDPSVCLSVRLSVFFHVRCLSVSAAVPVCLPVFLSVCLYVYLYNRVPVCLSFCFSVCLPLVCLSGTVRFLSPRLSVADLSVLYVPACVSRPSISDHLPSISL